MTLYGVALYLHILAAIGIVGGSCIGHYIHARMRRARTVEALTEWVTAAKMISKLMPVFALTLLLFGVYMTVAHWGWQQPWILVSLTLLIMISAAAPLLLDPNLRAVERAVTAGASLATIAELLADPVANIASGIFTVESFAIVSLMVMKPPLVPTLVIVILAAGIGAVVGRPKVSAKGVEATPVGADARTDAVR